MDALVEGCYGFPGVGYGVGMVTMVTVILQVVPMLFKA